MRDEVTWIGQQRSALLAFLAGVDGDRWDTPTVCSDWSVKDVLAHMVEGEINVGGVYRGETRELGRIDPHEGVARWRALPGEAIRAALWQHGIATQRVLEALTEEVWTQPIAAFGCRSIGQLVRLHLFDAAVHGHDLTEALGGPALWDPVLPFLTEFVVRAAPPTLTRKGADPAGSLTVAVPDLRRSWTIDGTGGSWRLTEDEAPGRWTIDAERLVLVATGREQDVAGAGLLERGGDQERAIIDAWRVV